ncbi:hypothetical protein K492DRAFT_192188 [Lichtheimia hyalospora FSU 10163]|nr:hypothetical protein K492DRAFT_192188 [Lichtheimia hyalospora FSU 10163]
MAMLFILDLKTPPWVGKVGYGDCTFLGFSIFVVLFVARPRRSTREHPEHQDACDPCLSKWKRFCVSPIHSFGGFMRQPRYISPGQTSDLVSATYKSPRRGPL